MNKDKIKTEIVVKDQKITVLKINKEEYISLTDLARYANKEDPSGVIRNWMSNKNSFDFYSLWEELNNPNLKGNIRDYTDLLHLVILNNLENINAEMIEADVPQEERLIKLNKIAKKQMKL